MLFVVGSFCPVIRQCCCFRTPVIVKYVPVPTSPTKFVSIIPNTGNIIMGAGGVVYKANSILASEWRK
jgi:hypothetical protein